MKLNINLSKYCNPDLITRAEYILKNDQLRSAQICPLPDGSRTLQARAVDSFHFVDHPSVTVSPEGDAILSFRCDCPQYRGNREFCPHCAGLVMKFSDGTDLPPCKSTTASAAAALPAAVQASMPEILEFSYTFCNSSRDLYPGIYRPEIPLKRFIQVFGDNPCARSLYQEYKPWGGSCFGMTITSTMFYIPHSGIDLADFDEKATCPSHLELQRFSTKLDMTLHAFIEAGLILQSSEALMSARFRQMRSPTCLDDLCDAVEQFQQTGEEPVCMAVWDTDYQGGHSVLPYRLERTTGSEDILLIYDPNCPLQVRHAYLEKDTQGHHIHWRFPMYNDYPYSDKTGGHITFDRYHHYKKAWDRRGSPDVHVLMTVEAGTSVLDSDGNALAAITGSGIRFDSEELFPHLPSGVGRKTTHSLFAPVAPYILRNDDASKEELSLQLTHTQQAVAVQTAGREAEILVDDQVQTQYAAITQPNVPYSITLTASLEGAWAEVKLEGITGPEGIRLAQHRGVLYCSPISEEIPVSLTVNGEPESTGILRTDLDEIFRIPAENQSELLTSAPKSPDEAEA